MKAIRWHPWQVTPAEAKEIQIKLAGKVIRSGDVENPSLIAGVDISVKKWAKTGTAAIVVLGYPGLEVVETRVETGPIDFPYVPGLLSFREVPLLLTVCEKLTVAPDLILVDGQGIAHPRRIGLASHLGLCLDTPTIGCAKSRLCGVHETAGDKAGSYTDLVDKGEVIGAVVRTRPGVKPLYISIGYKINQSSAIDWVLACCRGYRLPEPTRLAHLAAGGNLNPDRSIAVRRIG